jgi:hypothetical protein
MGAQPCYSWTTMPPSPRTLITVAAWLAPLVLACDGGPGSDEANTTTTQGDGDELRGPCDAADHVGGFSVAMEASYTAFSGSVADGVVPVTVLEQVGGEGDCVLLRRNNPFCNPTCSPGQTCDFDGTCIPYPVNQDLGTVSVSGLATPVEVPGMGPSFTYFDTDLPHPGMTPGAAIVLNTSGGAYDPIELHGIGVAMIEPSASELAIASGEALEVTWAASGSDARVRLELSVDQHGMTPVELVCDAPDTGSLTVSAALMTEFLAYPISGYPVADYWLHTTDSVDIAPGCVELEVRSHVQTPLSIAGHTPCNGDDDCPSDQTCDVMNQTCV